MPTLLAVARYGGFTAAARQLGMSASAVSQAVRAVEMRVGAPLFHRTTRAVALTEAGQGFVARVTPAAAEIAAAIDGLRHPPDAVSGRLRLNVPRVALPLAVQPVLTEVRRRYPDVVIEIAVDDASVDIVAAGFDAGVRVGSMIAGDMVTVRLTPPFKAVVAGAPSYLQTQGRPQALADLARHDCIAYRQKASGALYRWELVDPSGREVEVDVRGGLVVATRCWPATPRWTAWVWLTCSSRWSRRTRPPAGWRSCCHGPPSRSRGSSSTFPAAPATCRRCAPSSTAPGAS